ncbi:hypothetical protein QBC42DRAFT_278995 [Cladorrhinum samala]|uniref:Uncharacterized protein n=1 Tax=Cladorrhinum samala TaxID=585594 RepID=A0AAV9HBZ0_9PEZI|nr:hypothetical protein QBC42DRAFT_278995 [Cladorrhinum samala]
MDPKDKFSFCEDGDRPWINKYPKNAKFRPSDQVYVCVPGTTTREGPYKVAAVKPEKGLYKLNIPMKGDSWLTEKELELYDDFE